MSLEVDKLIAEGDWMTKPATKGDLMLVKTDLDARMDRLDTRIDRVDAKIDRVAVDLNGRLDRLDAKIETEIARLHRSMGRTVWLALAILGALGILLRFF